MALYSRPTDRAAALRALTEQRWTILAGGTDFYPALVDRTPPAAVLDISAIEELRGIERQGPHWRIGACTTWRDVIDTRLPPLFEGLKQAAREVGGVQIQNAGTVGGNICNASPAADGVVPLIALDAEVELTSLRRVRRLPLSAFISGPRRTALEAGELLSAVLVPAPTGFSRSRFLKLGARRYLVISIAMVCGTLTVHAGRVTRAAIAVGACAPVARRLPALEQALAGQPCTSRLPAVVEPEHLALLSPIDDVRGSGGYRSTSAFTLVRRCLAELAALQGMA